MARSSIDEKKGFSMAVCLPCLLLHTIVDMNGLMIMSPLHAHCPVHTRVGPRYWEVCEFLLCLLCRAPFHHCSHNQLFGWWVVVWAGLNPAGGYANIGPGSYDGAM